MLITEKLKEPKHSEMDQALSVFFLENSEQLEELSARMIAQQIYTAPSTVVRFCQRLGFKGFNDFKKAYLDEQNYLNAHFKDIDPNAPFSSRDRYVTIASKLSALYHETAVDTLSLLNHDILQQVTQMLHQSDTIYICSAGDSLEAGRTFKNRMIKIGKQVIVEERTDNMFYQACYATTKACFIVISYSGETERILRTAKKLAERRIPTIAITSYGENTLSDLISCVIYISTREKLIDNLGNFSAMLSISYILDTVYACMFNENYQTNRENKQNFSLENELYRKSNNPIIADKFRNM
ncbi:N-acetylmannosamine kinase [Enterococcus florum]|uniref:N-acetylmannosamine kinase n=1 Tax=Enterococcus florum TaxID=2480627 RepID=A0A4P5P9S2_9ENTE|nr:MurR/RpiR family transcriptional regulator [Enterococcus florum]GCF94845.1 N-acetylmannosamine kinase [Enterococcus florum]